MVAGVEDPQLLDRMGGHAALRYAATYPEAMERLVHGETVPEQRAPAREYLAAWLGQSDVFDNAEGAVRAVRPLIPRAPEAELRRWAAHNLLRRDAKRWTWRYDTRLRRPDGPLLRSDPATIRAALPRIACPTLGRPSRNTAVQKS